MYDDNINDYLPSILNPRTVRTNLSLTQNSIFSRRSLSLKRRNVLSTTKLLNKVTPKNKENSLNFSNLIQETQKVTKDLSKKQDLTDNDRLGFSAIEDLQSNKDLSAAILCDIDFNKLQKDLTDKNDVPDKSIFKSDTINDNKTDTSYIDVSSAIELDNEELQSASSIIYEVDQCIINVAFEVNDSETVDVNAKNAAIKRFTITHKDKSTNVDCELVKSSQISTESELDENENETSVTLKRPAVAVSLEIKKQKLTHDTTGNSKVLILNTNVIEKISHVIVQPPNYKFVTRNISNKSKYRNEKSGVRNGNINCARLNQLTIETFFRKGSDDTIDVSKQLGRVSNDGAEDMSKNLGVVDSAKCERSKTAKSYRRNIQESPKSAKLPSNRDLTPTKKQDVSASNSDAPSRVRNEAMSARSPGKRAESSSIHFSLPAKTKSNKIPVPLKSIPYHKIIAADLCMSRLAVNQKHIRVLNVDEVIRIDGVEIAAVDANHCPGALMLVFTLPNGKTLLHTGDFRACPLMESYPLFWNKDIHTVYLDTTYCNPRYDFPTQDQSLEMALYILRQKKVSLEKTGKKFSSVLIVCGTYTIGKEKFFVGMSRRVGCSVWACPEKERVLSVVDARACGREPPHACQLHVVPMRDLTHEKLRSYLDSLQGAFSEVVAFKPSGWESGKNSSVEKDSVAIHGIPYSEHSSFSELVRFVKYLKPKQVVPTVDISGGIKAVQKYFPCPIVCKEEERRQTVTDYFSIQNRPEGTAVT